MSFELWVLLVLGGIVGWCSLLILFYGVKLYWEWVDDNESKCPNWLIYLIMVKFGPYDGYRKGEYIREDDPNYSGWGVDDMLVLVLPICILFTIPTIAAVWLNAPTIAISIGTIVGLSYLVRFVCRLAKKLNRHLHNHK